MLYNNFQKSIIILFIQLISNYSIINWINQCCFVIFNMKPFQSVHERYAVMIQIHNLCEGECNLQLQIQYNWQIKTFWFIGGAFYVVFILADSQHPFRCESHIICMYNMMNEWMNVCMYGVFWIHCNQICVECLMWRSLFIDLQYRWG